MSVPPERSDEERLTKIRRDEARWRPGTLAYAALAILIAIALLLSAVTGLAARDSVRDQAFRTSAANCRVSESLSEAFVDLLNHSTAPRILGKGATPTQLAAQAAANAEASVYRASALAQLRALSCSKLAEGTPVAVPVAAPSPPPTVVGPAGDRGSSGLTGSIGLPGATGPQGPGGTDGKPGAAGSNGANGMPGVNGGPGPGGPPGADGTNGTDGAPGATGPLPPEFTFTVDVQTVTCVLDVDTYTCTTSPTP